MTTQVEQRNTQHDQNPGMRPTNNQVGGPGEFGSDPSQQGSRHLNQSRFDERPGISDNDGYNGTQQPAQQQQQAPPVHPSRTDQNKQYGQTYDQGLSQTTSQDQPHTLDRRGHRGPGAKARAAEAGAVAEGENLAHGGHHNGVHGAEHGQAGYGAGPGQNDHFATQQGQGMTTTGHNPARAAEAGATYEAGKLTHGQGHGHGQGQYNERFGGDHTGVHGTGHDETGYGAGLGRNDQFGTHQGQGTTGGTTGHNPARAAEAGATYEAGKLAHGHGHGHGPGQYNERFGGDHTGVHGAGHDETGYGAGSGQNDQFATQQGQGTAGGTTGHNPARAAEAGATYEAGKLAHGHGHGHGPGQYNERFGGDHTGVHGAGLQETGYGAGPGQNDQFATQQGQGLTGGTTGHHPARAAEAGATYEAGKLAHGHGHGHGQGQYDERFTPNVASGNQTGYATGQGAGPNAGQTAGQTQPHPTGVGAGTTTAAATGAAGATHPGVGYGTGAYNQPHAGATTTGAPGAHTGGTTTAPEAVPATQGATGGAGSGITGPSVASGQANVMLGKLQQAGGMLLRDDTMRAKGLEREAKGVAKADQNEATRLEGQAQARREKAFGTASANAPGGATNKANAGVDPTVGTHGRNL